MPKKFVNLLIYILEVSFFIYFYNKLNFLNIYSISFISLFSIYKLIRIKQTNTRKSVIVSLTSILIITSFIYSIPILKTLFDLTVGVFEEPKTSIDFAIFYIQIAFITASIAAFVFLALFGFLITSKTNSFYYFSLLIIICMFGFLSYIPFLNKYLLIFPTVFLIFYNTITKKIQYFSGKYLKFKYYI
jgi:hypothetical protein